MERETHTQRERRRSSRQFVLSDSGSGAFDSVKERPLNNSPFEQRLTGGKKVTRSPEEVYSKERKMLSPLRTRVPVPFEANVPRQEGRGRGGEW